MIAEDRQDEDKPHTVPAFVLATLAGAIAACGPGGDPVYEFALIGDNPYSAEEVPQFEAASTSRARPTTLGIDT